ncbi:MAG TPA: lysozyme inhibitor LprI family protein [Mycobacteriales bacterium]|nr:lysozyme inhibitor LprI family protein [Mycobacteriales bacterium]
MRARYLLPAVLTAGAVLAGCSSSGSNASGPPAATRTPTIVMPSSSPTLTPTPVPLPTGVPKVRESFSVLPCPSDPTSTLDMEGCAEHRIRALDRQINSLTKILFGEFSDNGKQNLIAAQAGWDSYRHAECQSESDVYEGGTLAGVVAVNCFARLAAERLKALQGMQDSLGE